MKHPILACGFVLILASAGTGCPGEETPPESGIADILPFGSEDVGGGDPGCVPACAGKVCGDDGCGGSCGTCTGDREICVEGQCACQPTCEGKECGDDGCGGECGPCTNSEAVCLNNLCCTPDCAGKVCGNNGCGGKCGTCKENEGCFDGACSECPEVDWEADPCSSDGLSLHGGFTNGDSGCMEVNWMPCAWDGGPGSTCYHWTTPDGDTAGACSCEGNWTPCNTSYIRGCCSPNSTCQVFSETSTGCL